MSTKHLAVSLSRTNQFVRGSKVLTFLMDGDKPVPASMQMEYVDLPEDVIRQIELWADFSMNNKEFRIVELVCEGSVFWFVPDSYRILERGDMFDTLYTASKFAVN